MNEVARSESARGDMVLLRRDDRSLELRVNGVFVMDTVETSAERALAAAALGAVTADLVTVLVGGLGLGFTLAEVLRDDRVVSVTVAEIEPDLVRWHRAGVVPAPEGGAPALDSSRVEVVVGDVRRHVRTTPAATYDLVLLDVDNGPGYLVYDDNRDVYGLDFLAECARIVRPGGLVAIWSADRSTELLDVMRTTFTDAPEQAIPVRLGNRDLSYHLYLGRV